MVPVVFHSERRSIKAANVFVVFGAIVSPSSMMRSWGFKVVSLQVVLTCIVKCGKCMKPCVVSTTLFFFINCNTLIGPVSFLTTKCSTNMLSPISKLTVAVANSFSSWLFAACFWKLGGSSILRVLLGAFCFYVSNSSRAIALT